MVVARSRADDCSGSGSELWRRMSASETVFDGLAARWQSTRAGMMNSAVANS